MEVNQIMSCKIIAEIGINHNGSIKIAKELIDIATIAGCDYVKFQKRDLDLCIPEKQKNVLRKTPWGEMKYIDYKRKIEFEKEEYDILSEYCLNKKIGMFFSVWDLNSLNFLKSYSDLIKIPSAHLTNNSLLKAARKNASKLMISTGMATEEEVQNAIKISEPDIIMHTNSAYPSKVEDLNLRYISRLIKNNENIEIGYSGHEYGLVTTFAAVAMGARWVERHITIDRALWGTDQLASIEPIGLIKLVKGIKDIEKSLGSDGPRTMSEIEMNKRETLSHK
jgi:N-acetylneuraminate synthase